MKHYLIAFFLLMSPVSVFAAPQIFLDSDQSVPFSSEKWTSTTTPNQYSDTLSIKSVPVREDVPHNYILSSQDIKDLLLTLDSVGEDEYQSLKNFDSENLSKYLALAIDPNIESDISSKSSAGYELTPFESTFASCSINLSEREDIVKTLINRIDNGDFADIENMEYSNKRFGDCIIPFPDKGSTFPAYSFPSNKVINSPLTFSDALEQSASVLDASAQTSELQSELDIESQRLESSGLDLAKDHGRNRITYIHQNHLINPFVNSLISGGNVDGGVFDTSHDLYISSSDSEQERIILPWKKIKPGVYKKILLQENSYDGSGNPKQSVGATSYYAILYNHDITPPLQEKTFFAHDNGGDNIFILPENAWFNSEKYGYFLCSDIESGCACASDNPECFIRDERVFSTPEIIKHNSPFSREMKNNAGSGSTFVSDPGDTLQYDFETPDIQLFYSGSQIALNREYVRNSGVKYDGVEIRGKRFYNIENTFEYEADDTLDIDFEIFDINPTDTDQAKSGIGNYDIKISEFSNASWSILGSLSGTGAEQVSLADINDEIADTDIMTHAARYQFMIEIEDVAGNLARIIGYFRILPAPIDTDMSTLGTLNRDTLYADNSQNYNYTLTIMDKFGNPIIGREIVSIEQSCLSAPLACQNLKTDMTTSIPTGFEALTVSTLDTLSGTGGEVGFSLKSLAPGVFTERFRVEFQNPTETYYFSGEDNTFLRPFIGNLETFVAGDGWLDDTLIVGSEEDYRVKIDDTVGLGESWSINDFSSYINGKHTDTGFSLSGSLSTGTDGIYFKGTFTSSLSPDESHKEILEIENADKSPVIIRYNLSGNTIKYNLSSNEYDEIPPMSLRNTLSSPVYIQGLLQGVGNAHNPEEQQNITDIDTSLKRSMIRKNVAKHIMSRNSGNIINGVKYIDKTDEADKNYVIESSPSYQTLVVRNGNILITDNFNTAHKNIGIISYKDGGYNVLNGYNEVGNIYIEANVSEIHALIYADGGLISTRSGTPVSSSLSAREYYLGDQLTVYGSIFTRNTLAGAEEAGGNYLLPGGEQSSDRSTAIQYDLYYLRRGNTGCAQDGAGFCNIPQYFIIDYDTRATRNPPILFAD